VVGVDRASSPGANMKATTTLPHELGSDERRLWAQFCEDKSLESPFLSWEFANALGKTRTDSRVAVVEDDGVVVGFLPFQIASNGRGVPLGASISDAQAFIAPRPWTFDATRLVAEAGMTTWSFDHLVVDQEPFAPFHRSRHRSPFVDLAGGYEAFLGGLRGISKDFLPQVLRRRRKLEREIGPVALEWRSRSFSSDMSALQRWKSEQYRRTAVWDRFAQPWIITALESLGDVDGDGGLGVLSSLRAGDRLAAVHFGLVNSRRFCWWFPTYDPELGSYSPGLILLLELISAAAQRGIDTVDLGRGEHDYKLRVTDRFYEVAEGELATEKVEDAL
jgi:CelD/BcsL family acetyltransferase involved in cellulose biosynthesis